MKRLSFKDSLQRVIFLIMLLAVILMNVFACRTTMSVDNSPVTKVDMNKFLGRWYELARFDHRFERNMDNCTATYTQEHDGSIKITNRGKKDGKWNISVGKAKHTDAPGILRVSFFRPFYSDYRILMLATDYSYALIGGSDEDYLWILSRTPQLEYHKLCKIISEAQRRGYDTENLIWVEQNE